MSLVDIYSQAHLVPQVLKQQLFQKYRLLVFQTLPKKTQRQNQRQSDYWWKKSSPLGTSEADKTKESWFRPWKHDTWPVSQRQPCQPSSITTHTLCFCEWYLPRKALERQLLRSDQARKTKERDQWRKTQTTMASWAEVKPFLKLSRQYRPLTAHREGQPVLFFPPILPLLFLSAQSKRTIEGKAASHGNMKHFTTEKYCNSLLSYSRSCTLALALTWSRGLPQAIHAASWSSLVKIQTFQRWKTSHESGHKNVCCLTSPLAHDWCWLEGPDFKHPNIPSSEEMGNF